MKKVKKVIILLIILVIAGFMIWFFFGRGGNGSDGDGNGDSSSTAESSETEVTKEITEVENDKGNIHEIVIEIKEDKVLANDKQIKDKEELKSYIDENNTDDMKYVLKQENAILATYNWVVETLDELKIGYTEEKK